MTRKFAASYASELVKQIALGHAAKLAASFEEREVNGKTAPAFIDCNALQADPAAWRDVIDALICRIDDSAAAFDAVAGAHCSCPMLAQSIAYRTGVPYGTAFLAGTPNREAACAEVLRGKKVLLIEDALFSGRTGAAAAAVLRGAGAEVTHVAALVDFGLEEARAVLQDAGLQGIAALRLDEVIEEAVRQGRIGAGRAEAIRAGLKKAPE